MALRSNDDSDTVAPAMIPPGGFGELEPVEREFTPEESKALGYIMRRTVVQGWIHNFERLANHFMRRQSDGVTMRALCGVSGYGILFTPWTYGKKCRRCLASYERIKAGRRPRRSGRQSGVAPPR